MEHRILIMPALTLVGFEARFFGPLSPRPNNLEVIPPLWNALFARSREIVARAGSVAYGANRCLAPHEGAQPGELLYLAGFPVEPDAPVPAGMVRWTLPAQLMARFTHRGPIWKLGETLGAIHNVHLSAAGLVRADAAELELYDERFGTGGEGSELDLFVPVIE